MHIHIHYRQQYIPFTPRGGDWRRGRGGYHHAQRGGHGGSSGGGATGSGDNSGDNNNQQQQQQQQPQRVPPPTYVCYRCGQKGKKSIDFFFHFLVYNTGRRSQDCLIIKIAI